MMKKTMCLAGLLTMSTALFVSAQQSSLFTTTNDFSLFQNGSPVLSSDYYSDSGNVNGLGNAASVGGAGGIGSLELTLPGGWGTVSDGPGVAGNQAFLSAIDPGSGPGTLVNYSGTLSFDVYTANLTSWAQFGVLFNYDNNWTPFFSSTTTSITGADGRTWTHAVVPYTIAATSLSYFGFSIMENSDGGSGGVGGVIGENIYVDNFQVTVAPEPGTAALLALGGMALLFLRRRAVR